LDISIVVVNRNTRQLLMDCLASVLVGVDGLEIEMFVVDEHSSDGSADAVRTRFPAVKVIDDPSDCGFGHANNLGLRQARGRYLLTLNADTEVPPGALPRLVAWMDAHPRVGVIGPRLVKADGSLDLACRRSFPTPTSALYRYLGLARIFPKNKRFGAYNMTYLDPDVAGEMDSGTAACMLVRREATMDVGFFDEDYFMYGEDLDWAYRLKKAGWMVYYLPEVTVLHHKGQATKQRSTRMIIEFHRAMLTFNRKHYAAQQPRPLTWAVTAGVVLHAVVSVARNGLRPREQRRVG